MPNEARIIEFSLYLADKWLRAHYRNDCDELWTKSALNSTPSLANVLATELRKGGWIKSEDCCGAHTDEH